MSSFLVALTSLALQNPFLGTWVAERPQWGDPTHGTLELIPRDQALRIRFRGEEVEATRDASGLYSASFPGAGRAEIRRGKEGYRGFWVRPASPESSAYATPLRFERLRAVVSPYRDRTPLVLRLSATKEGLEVLAREKERNRGYYLALTGATQEGSRLVFASRRHPRVEAQLVGEEALRLSVPWSSLPTYLRRSSEPRVRGLHPRVSSFTRAPPRPQEGGWPVDTPAAVHISEGPLDQLVQELAAAEPRSVSDPMVHALLVARRGKLVVEEYFFDHAASDLHDTRSAGKSVNSMLVGAFAAREELDPSRFLARPVCGLDAQYKKACASDPRKAKITLAHALSMTTGLACDDDDYESPGSEDRMQNQTAEPNWHRYILEVPVARAPGAKAVYCTAGINLTGVALESLSEASVPELFDTLIARPLGIDHYHWNLAPNGVGYLGGGVRLRPRDFLKLGELMRKDGVWKGQRLLPKGWSAFSTAARSGIHAPGDYAYGWWRKTYTVRGRELESYYASGNGGQLLFVVPELELVVAFLGGNYGNFGAWRQFRDDYLPRILAAVDPKPS